MNRWEMANARAQRVAKKRHRVTGRPCKHGLMTRKCKPCRAAAVKLANERYRDRWEKGKA